MFEFLSPSGIFEFDVIKFTKEEEENNKLAVLDLEINVNRKTKKIEFKVHYKKTNKNIMIKKNANHKESIKTAVIKGYGDRARALYDTQYMTEELKNVEQVFVENGYTTKKVRKAMKEKERTDENDETEEPTIRGVALMPNIPEFTTKFNNTKTPIHSSKENNKQVRDLTSNAKTPLGDKKSNTVSNIPCKCGE